MLKIGDLLLGILVDDKGFSADLTAKAGKAGDKAGATLGQRMTGQFKKAGAGLTDGLKLGAGIAAFGALDTAVSAVVGVLGDAVAAAREDQASIAGLDNALRKNIPSWDGNTAAIEKVITARMRLGFTDEEQRKSMELLVGATHDVNKALDIQRIAMDLAVRKHISLEEASTALIKVEGGQYRALKALGIVLPKNATAEEALAAAQKVTAGAAEAEANTDEGKLKAAQIALGERLEKLGYVVMPLVTDAMLAIADASGPIVDGISDVVKAVVDANDWLTKLTASSSAAAGSTDLLGDNTTLLGKALHGLAEAPGGVADMINGTSDAARASAASFDYMASHVKDDSAAIVVSVDKIPKAANRANTKVTDSLHSIVNAFNTTKAALEGAASDAADAIYDPIIAKAELATNRRDIAETKAAIRSGTLRGQDLADAKQKLAELEKTQITLLATTAAYGDKSSATTLENMIATLKATRNLSSEQIAQLKLLELELDRVRYHANEMHNALSTGHNTGGQGDRGRARGGYAPPGWTGRVGEGGREETLHVLRGGGAYVVPHAMSPSDGAGGAGSGHTITINNPEPAAADDDIGRMLRRLAAVGI
jgi:hypothetical protein